MTQGLAIARTIWSIKLAFPVWKFNIIAIPLMRDERLNPIAKSLINICQIEGPSMISRNFVARFNDQYFHIRIDIQTTPCGQQA